MYAFVARVKPQHYLAQADAIPTAFGFVFDFQLSHNEQ
jgi:hypothetical protein